MSVRTGQEFMVKTRYRYMETSDQNKGLPPPPLEMDYDEAKPLIDLPPPPNLPAYEIDLRTAIANRRSARQYADQDLTLNELSFLLWCTQGIRETVDTYATLRTVPSAGARHAFETFLLVNSVEGLQPGLYRYLATAHKLIEENTEAGLVDRITEACWGQTHVKTSGVTFLWVAVAYRMTWRYGERGYRYLHLDAGHVCQNLYLAAEAIGAGVCAIAAFSDEDLNKSLDLDGEEQFVIYLATLGKKP